jgi:hypothetical protein
MYIRIFLRYTDPWTLNYCWNFVVKHEYANQYLADNSCQYNRGVMLLLGRSISTAETAKRYDITEQFIALSLFLVSGLIYFYWASLFIFILFFFLRHIHFYVVRLGTSMFLYIYWLIRNTVPTSHSLEKRIYFILCVHIYTLLVNHAK